MKGDNILIMTSSWNYKFKISDNRKLKNALMQDRMIAADYVPYHDPNLLPDYNKAANLILNAIQNHKNILIFGDYDADGITATMILYKFLSTYTAVEYIIPDRFRDGYGLGVETAKRILENDDVDLVITVDNGITSIDAVKLLKDNGLDVVITDHHTCLNELPAADAVVNCHREDSRYPFSDLCGAGVAFKIVQGLVLCLNDNRDLTELLDLAAIGTIADVMPLVDENRTIVSQALPELANSRSIGLQALVKSIESLRTKSEITSEDVAFSIAPRINAASRMGCIDIVTNLLLSDNTSEAVELASRLDKINEERKSIEADVTSRAVDLILRDNLYDELCPIMVVSSGWHKGVIGITAAKLSDKFHCPSFVGTIENGIIIGSARSYGDFNIVEALSSASDILISYGGHPGAGGFKLPIEQLNNFKERIFMYSYSNPWDGESQTCADALIPFGGITMDLVNDLNTLGPFGEANSVPMFISENVIVNTITAIGKDKNTLKMTARDLEGNTLNCIGFSMGLWASYCLKPGDCINIMYKLSINQYAGKSSVQAVISDIEVHKLSEYSNYCQTAWSEEYNRYRRAQAGQYEALQSDEIPSDDDYKTLYKVLSFLARFQRQKKNGVPVNLVWIISEYALGKPISLGSLFRIIEVINESNFLKMIVTYDGLVYIADIPGILTQRLSTTSAYQTYKLMTNVGG